jgi:hypothetical protein
MALLLPVVRCDRPRAFVRGTNIAIEPYIEARVVQILARGAGNVLGTAVICDNMCVVDALRLIILILNPFAAGVGYTRLGCPLRSVESSNRLHFILRPDLTRY